MMCNNCCIFGANSNTMDTKVNAILSIALFTGLGIFSYLLLVNYTDLQETVAEALNSVGAFVFFIIAFNVVGYVTVKLSSWLNNQYAVNIRKRWKILAGYVAVMLMFLLLNYGLLVAAKLMVGGHSPFTFTGGGFRILIVVWLVELVILGLLLANKSMQNTLKLQIHASELQEENNKARYTALQNQLNPHFLFNSLNTLIAEIEYDPKNAIGFTKNLSRVYRYVLQCQEKPLVTLGEELEFARSYMFLHAVRLGNCIQWNMDIPDDTHECMLPPLTLQLLIENVIKHNTIIVGKPMVIEIGVKDEYLIVSNPVNPKRNNESSGVGLLNLSNRCKLILGKDICIINENQFFIVKVPLSYE